MAKIATGFEAQIIRQVFETWSLAIPMVFSEEFETGERYWHAWDKHRSVSLTSIVLTDGTRPVTAREVMELMPPMEGEPVPELPPDLLGWAVRIDTEQPARASRALTGMLATDGRVLLATITADDLDWATSIWMSIRRAAPVMPMAPVGSGRAERRREQGVADRRLRSH